MARTSAPRFALCSTRIVTPVGERSGAIIVNGETIESVVDTDNIPPELEILDVANAIVSPGVIDAHVHVNEPGRTDWEGFSTATAAAAAGGVTTIVDMPLNSSPVTTSVAALEQKLRAARGQCTVDVGFYGGLIRGNAEQVGPMIEAGVLGIKAFLCHSGLDEFPSATVADLRAAMPHIAARSVPLLVHCELTDSGAPQPRDPRAYAEYCRSRPDRWEVDAIMLMIDLCRAYHCPVHVVHLSSAEALDIIAAAKAEGLPLTVETCPHYLYFSAERIADGDTRFKCAPPIRSDANRERLWNALQSGLIDTLGSDHSPCPAEMKCLAAGDFTQAWGGIASLQWTLPIVWTEARNRGVGFRQLASWLSQGPATLVGLQHKKGRIAAGYDADLVVWDADAEFQVDRKSIRHKHKLTPYEGERLFGVVKRTYLRGRIVFDHGQVVGQPTGAVSSQPRRGQAACTK